MASARERLGIGLDAWSKLDSTLQRELESRSTENAVVPVMIVLHAALSATAPGERARQMDEAVADLEAELMRLGARDVRHYWINATVSASVPPAAFARITERAEVAQILLVTRHRAVC